MKTVMNSSMVAHTWMHQTQDKARNSSGSFYFEGPTIYSYGRHFPIATIHNKENGQPLVLFNRSRYSATTSQHQAAVRNAINGQWIEVPIPTATSQVEHMTNLKYLESKYFECCQEALTSIKYTKDSAERRVYWQNRHKEYREFFNLDVESPRITREWLSSTFPKRFSTITEEKPALIYWLEAVKERIQHQEEKAKVQHIRDAENRARREAEQAKKAEKQIQEWIAGMQTNLYAYSLPVFLRLKPTDAETVQTSRGAEIPLKHAQLLWEKVKQARNEGKTYVRNGHTVYAGTFAVDSIDSEGTLIAGCHKILYLQMENFAKRLGWTL